MRLHIFLKSVATTILLPFIVSAQNPVYIPPALNGTTFNLNIQAGTTTFFTGYNTPTYGINGVWMAPTLFFNQGDSVTINVTNNLPVTTTIHWHGLHVPSKWDGGPHQTIISGNTWSPKFKVLNDAGTFWYHPHGDTKTELHVSRGIAGMIIIRDPIEGALTLPRTYGVDDFPVIVQSKAFDILKQIAIATEDDTSIMVNGTMQPFLNAPAQVIRLRLLNGSSMRTFLFGLDNNVSFTHIGSDDGLLDNAVSLTRLRLSPGERAEILVNLTGMNGQTIYLKNYGSELPTGIHGATVVGTGMAEIPGYSLNPLNGGDYTVMQINVTPQTTMPVTTLPTALVPQTQYPLTSVNKFRTFTFDPEPPVDSAKMTEGPFLINGNTFDMAVVNDTVKLGHTEVWTLINNTLIAHPFHIHDVFFYVLDVNGNPPTQFEAGKKDVVLVQPHDTLRFITRFEDFADADIPYMYHCHLLHHEDEGMMGSFIVLDSTLSVPQLASQGLNYKVYPNPGADYWNIDIAALSSSITYELFDMVGHTVQQRTIPNSSNGTHFRIESYLLPSGVYTLRIHDGDSASTIRLTK